MFRFFQDLYNYRFMVASLVRRDIRGRYKGSVLGILWNFIIPITQMLIYTIVFSQLFNDSVDNFAVFLITAMVPWILFNESLSAGSGSIIDNNDMLKKIYFPRCVLPVSIVLSKTINFLITLLIVELIATIMGYPPTATALMFVPFYTALLLAFVIGITLILSAIDAYFRDIQYIVTVMLTAMYWITPIVYERSQMDFGLLQIALSLNPMTYFAEAFRSALYYGCAPGFDIMIACISLAVGFLIVGVLVFYRLERDFAEVI